MTSDFSAARVHLQRAYDYLKGNDNFSGSAREALDTLIEAIALVECQPTTKVLHYPTERRAKRDP